MSVKQINLFFVDISSVGSTTEFVVEAWKGTFTSILERHPAYTGKKIRINVRKNVRFFASAPPQALFQLSENLLKEPLVLVLPHGPSKHPAAQAKYTKVVLKFFWRLHEGELQLAQELEDEEGNASLQGVRLLPFPPSPIASSLVPSFRLCLRWQHCTDVSQLAGAAERGQQPRRRGRRGGHRKQSSAGKKS